VTYKWVVLSNTTIGTAAEPDGQRNRASVAYVTT
jgi:hypothetical protein